MLSCACECTSENGCMVFKLYCTKGTKDNVVRSRESAQLINSCSLTSQSSICTPCQGEEELKPTGLPTQSALNAAQQQNNMAVLPLQMHWGCNRTTNSTEYHSGEKERLPSHRNRSGTPIPAGKGETIRTYTQDRKTHRLCLGHLAQHSRVDADVWANSGEMV